MCVSKSRNREVIAVAEGRRKQAAMDFGSLAAPLAEAPLEPLLVAYYGVVVIMAGSTLVR